MTLPVLISVALALTATPDAPPAAVPTGYIYSAIWNDLGLNGLIGNGNHLAWLWWNAGQQDAQPIPLHIQDLSCTPNTAGYRCAFGLLRDGGPRAFAGETAPDRIACTAQLVPRDDSWAVQHHRPSPRGGHSRTDMRCEVPPAAGDN